jgi:hypothetical protein
VLLIVVLEGREKTMCDSWFLLLLGKGVEAQQHLLEYSSSVPWGVVGGNCWIE